MYETIIKRTFDESYVIENGTRHIPNPDSDPTLTDEQREYYRPKYEEVRAYAEAHPECVTEEEPYVPPVPTFEEVKATKKAQIDAETSAAILAGFDYAVDGATYHFSYALDDQQNFSDTANVCLMKQTGMPGLPDSVTWNAYTPDGDMVRLTFDAPGFLALYTDGAMKHKNGTMQRGGERKAAVKAATTLDEVAAA